MLIIIDYDETFTEDKIKFNKSGWIHGGFSQGVSREALKEFTTY